MFVLLCIQIRHFVGLQFNITSFRSASPETMARLQKAVLDRRSSSDGAPGTSKRRKLESGVGEAANDGSLKQELSSCGASRSGLEVDTHLKNMFLSVAQMSLANLMICDFGMVSMILRFCVIFDDFTFCFGFGFSKVL